MIILAVVLAFIAGFMFGKCGKFYFYVGGELYTEIGSDKFILYTPELHGIGADLYGIDYTDGVLSPVYRPVLKWLYKDKIAGVIISTGDFHELLIMVSTEFPFLKIKHIRDTSIARSPNE
jgi:hypothetical protein